MPGRQPIVPRGRGIGDAIAPGPARTASPLIDEHLRGGVCSRPGFVSTAGGYRRVAVAIDEIEYHALLLRVRELRRVVEEVGSMSATGINAAIDARLRGQRPAQKLPPGQITLIDELVGILKQPGLSPMQAQGLDQAFRTR